MESPTDPEASESLSRAEAETFIALARKIFDAMGTPGKLPRIFVMEPLYNDDPNRTCQIHFICFDESHLSGAEEEVPDASD